MTCSSSPLVPKPTVTHVPPPSELFPSRPARMQTGSMDNSVPSEVGNERRRHLRIRAVLPVQVNGNDAFGNSFQEIAHTLDVTPTGARLGAIHHELKVLNKLTVQYRRRKMGFRAVWTRPLEGSGEYQVGLQGIGQEEKVWGLDLSASALHNAYAPCFA